MPAKKSAQKRETLIEAYLDHLMDEGKPPASVRKFCRGLGITEKAFYGHFASFEAMEGGIWASMIEDTVEVLESDEDYASYPARQKLGAFYYTFLETALDQRSYLLLRFPGIQLVNPPVYLQRFQKAFNEFAKPLLAEAKDSKEVASRGRLNQAYPGLLYAQFLFVIDFWLKDESDGFERTDALVEKSTSLAFDLVGAQVLDSALDFVRFMAGEKGVA
ncbi:TetR family transcriptional regulator C-terminal domain-containing protein [Rubellicoccus peritrichatus]|uniref:TetR family transcriptional regulator C-terminal domain-containing protein n=1 Tax=Rubellicoccus peritrichatus TaxID=3080537 RepID=A0AAQ3L915_9BACT|nr:TetR family transcriptional regulator C-terminal domain-containing protein [Puniceicoccus sp. CR14]WOO40164.1 TetR family transcriptional regulator C-terminal domain-containing protein [Puniceicoccus sp. CR14]